MLNILSKRYLVFVFVDDVVLMAKSRRAAGAGRDLLRNCLKKHSFPGRLPEVDGERPDSRLLSIHEDGDKAPRVFAPNEPVEGLMGFTLCGVRP